MWSRDLIASRINIAWCLVLGAVKWGKLSCRSCVMPWVSGRWCWPGTVQQHLVLTTQVTPEPVTSLDALPWGFQCWEHGAMKLVVVRCCWTPNDMCGSPSCALQAGGFGCCELALGCAHVWLVSDPSEAAEFTPLIPDCPSRSSFAAWGALAWQTVMLHVYGSLAGGGCYPTGKHCPF